MKIKFFFVFLIIIQHKYLVASSSQSQFKIDRNLVPSIYESTVKEVRGDHYAKLNSNLLTPQFSLFMPTQLQLSNSYYAVAYENNLASFPILSVISSNSSPWWKNTTFESYGQMQLGYGYAEGVYTVISDSQLLLKDTIKLHCMPLLMSMQTVYTGLIRMGLQGFLTTGLGGHWYYQSGMLDGTQQGYWIPTSQIGGGIMVLSNEKTGDQFFQGLRLGVSYLRSFKETQKLKAWSFDIGTGLLL